MAFPYLSNVPMEFVERIVTFLDLPDICNLRLVAREVREKASQGLWNSHFRAKKILLTEPQLEHAVSVAQRGRSAKLLEQLTLVGLPMSTSEPESQEREEQRSIRLKLLQQFLDLLCLKSARGCLPPISLVVEGAGNDGPDRPRIWDATASCFNTIFLALGSSKLPVEALDIFGSVRCCSLACDQVTAMLAEIQTPILADSLRGLKQLSMSLSFHETHKPESEYMQSRAFGQANTKAVCQFLESCPSLEDLQLHWYSTYSAFSNELTDALSEEMSFFDRIAQSCRFPSLVQCSLKGIHTSEAALLLFLDRVQQLRCLDMDNIHISTRGKFAPVFEHLSKNMLQLEYLHLDNLYEEKLIQFSAPGKPHFPSTGANGPNTITRTGPDFRKPIKCRPGRGHALGSPLYSNWAAKLKRQYGPSRYTE